MDIPANKHVFFKLVKFKEIKTFQITMGELIERKGLIWNLEGKLKGRIDRCGPESA